MPKTRINCPNCRQPIMAEVDQLFDFSADPTAKQRLLSGAFNLVQCPMCGYQGALATPVVYHDAGKELLLTFVPSHLGLPRDEQEKVIGGMINQVINKLPQEKRKAYLLRPQESLTLQNLVERVLEADGITKEMIQAQQKRLSLLQRLVTATDENARNEIAKQDDQWIDDEFFTLLRRLAEAAMANGDQESARKLAELQKGLLPITTFGKHIQEQTNEVEAAIRELRAEGQELTRERMLDLVVKAPNETRLGALVGLARPIMDYQFFQILSERIERARGDGRTRLVELREKLLNMTKEIDQQLEAHVQDIHKIIQAILKESDIKKAMEQSLSVVDDYFVRELNQQLAEARKQGDLEKSSKLQQMMSVIEEASKQSAEVALLQDYLDASDEATRQKFLETHQDQITQEFLEMLTSVTVQAQSGDDKVLAERASAANSQALRFSMQRTLRGQ
jgi:hypothetical protein